VYCDVVQPTPLAIGAFSLPCRLALSTGGLQRMFALMLFSDKGFCSKIKLSALPQRRMM
jgi:hypothetical protein